MSEQLDFFSAAAKHIDEGEQAIIELDFERARLELQSAFEIDPYLVNLDAFFKVIEFFKENIDVHENLGKNLAALWWRIHAAVDARQLTLKQAQLADEYIAMTALKNIENQGEFVDEGDLLPPGEPCTSLTKNILKRVNY